MWLFTPIGYFSIVEKPWDRREKTLTVRTRARADLAAFLKAAGVRRKIVVSDDSDYRYRVRLPKDLVARTVGALVMRLDYDNFKSEVHRVDPDRARVYGRVWSDLLPIQRAEEPPRAAIPRVREVDLDPDRYEHDLNTPLFF